MAKILLLALTLFLAAAPQNAAAQDAVPAAIGTIAEIEGPVIRYAHDEIAADAKVGMAPEIGQLVYMNDVIETGAGAKAHILFIDDTELTLGENASITVDEYVFDAEDTSANKGRFNLNGTFSFVSGLIGKRENPDVLLETPYGSIGIRGTVVWGGPLDEEYNVFVQEGAVTVATERGRVNVAAGEGTMIQGRRAIPTRAKAWGEEKIARANRATGLKNREQAKQRVAQFKERHAGMREKHKEAVMKKRGLRKEQQQQRQQQIQQKRDDRGQKKLDRDDIPQPSGEKKTEGHEPPKERRQAKQDREPPATPAREFEKREKSHLERPRAAPPQGANRQAQ